MFSFNSIKTFFKVNIFLTGFGYIEYIINKSRNDLFNIYISTVLRNYLLIDVVNYQIKDKKDIGIRTRPIESFYKEFDLYLLSTCAIEALTTYFIRSAMLNDKEEHIIQDIIYFIPISFLFEISFDLFHYTAHRIAHHKSIYKYLHKTHHKHIYPTAITTFYQNPIDMIFSNSIPTILAFYISSQFYDNTHFMFSMMSMYKVFIEIYGHIGKNPNSSSFAQFYWLPRVLNIELRTEDHDLHHTRNNCNYAKRFSLWDKLFGTYFKKNNINNK